MPFGHQVSRETLCPLGQPEKAIGEKSPIEPWLALHNHSACCVRNRRASLREHDESAEKEQSQSLVTLLGLDGKTIFPVPYRRGGAISLDIPFYRTGLSSCGKQAKARSGEATFQDLACPDQSFLTCFMRFAIRWKNKRSTGAPAFTASITHKPGKLVCVAGRKGCIVPGFEV